MAPLSPSVARFARPKRKIEITSMGKIIPPRLGIIDLICHFKTAVFLMKESLKDLCVETSEFANTDCFAAARFANNPSGLMWGFQLKYRNTPKISKGISRNHCQRYQ